MNCCFQYNGSLFSIDGGEEFIEEYDWIVNCEQIEYEPKEVSIII